MEISDEVNRGQEVYSKPILSIYDLWVLGISNQFIWKCPTKRLLAHFNNHISSNHLDIGVGTGYFIDKCNLPTATCRIGLMDLNQNSLNEAGKRIKRYKPSKYRFNVLDEVKLDISKFDSISVNYLFHCLPGKLSDKLVVLDNVDHLLLNNGIIFGSTILSHGVAKSRAAIKLMSLYNKKGIFCNAEDSIEDLESYLSNKYSDYKIEVQGCVAIFSATKLCS
ncbi:MAG: class I SAM-dependent methyltransferase [Candidatus Scalindua sp.]|nr:class I SAM-dependent methyltransferase [Candidatus Scalindua sp.]MBT5305127.1 class I SAM-dependent methyltransferase [Candidatus Scalindua sp.]MBT6051694.1 class I SAM-dependent methyltransferase [Candidatus Scalindua sp.]MBT6229645.1 class I SAM-dependent methyltransferase [Candidatus Scalindua sp.]MBT6562080.1 class I SAM-dependent methyltransferase [Candidatus Scalindua sp.]